MGHKKNGDPIHRYVLARTQKGLIVKLHDCIEMYRDADLTEDSNMTLGSMYAAGIPIALESSLIVTGFS